MEYKVETKTIKRFRALDLSTKTHPVPLIGAIEPVIASTEAVMEGS